MRLSGALIFTTTAKPFHELFGEGSVPLHFLFRGNVYNGRQKLLCQIREAFRGTPGKAGMGGQQDCQAQSCCQHHIQEAQPNGGIRVMRQGLGHSLALIRDLPVPQGIWISLVGHVVLTYFAPEADARFALRLSCMADGAPGFMIVAQEFTTIQVVSPCPCVNASQAHAVRMPRYCLIPYRIFATRTGAEGSGNT